MDTFINELKKTEKRMIIEVMAFMSYNPSIGRVLEKGGVKKFQKMSLQKVYKLENIKSIDGFDKFHSNWISEFIDKIKTNKNEKCSYGQAQKPINVFLKLYVDWSGLPDQKTSRRILKFLHVPLDSILMKVISKKYERYYKSEIKHLLLKSQKFSLSKINCEIYMGWQKLFRNKYPKKPLLFDVAWAINR